MTRNELERLVIFCILMESGRGILGKSPSYIKEKFEATSSVPYPESLLDGDNRKKLEEYFRKWGVVLV